MIRGRKKLDCYGLDVVCTPKVLLWEAWPQCGDVKGGRNLKKWALVGGGYVIEALPLEGINAGLRVSLFPQRVGC